MLQSNEHLLKAALDRIALAMLGPSLKEYPSEEHLAILGEPLLGLLDENARIAAPVRRKALDLLARVICSVRDPPFSATANQVLLLKSGRTECCTCFCMICQCSGVCWQTSFLWHRMQLSAVKHFASNKPAPHCALMADVRNFLLMHSHQGSCTLWIMETRMTVL